MNFSNDPWKDKWEQDQSKHGEELHQWQNQDITWDLPLDLALDLTVDPFLVLCDSCCNSFPADDLTHCVTCHFGKCKACYVLCPSCQGPVCDTCRLTMCLFCNTYACHACVITCGQTHEPVTRKSDPNETRQKKRQKI